MAPLSPEDRRVLRYISSIEPLIDSQRTFDDAAASIRCPVDVLVESIERMVETGLLVREQMAVEADVLTGKWPRSIRLTLAGQRLLESSI